MPTPKNDEQLDQDVNPPQPRNEREEIDEDGEESRETIGAANGNRKPDEVDDLLIEELDVVDESDADADEDEDGERDLNKR